MIICQYCKNEIQPTDIVATAATLNIGTAVVVEGQVRRGGGFMLVLPPAVNNEDVQYLPHKSCILEILGPLGFQDNQSIRPYVPPQVNV